MSAVDLFLNKYLPALAAASVEDLQALTTDDLTLTMMPTSLNFPVLGRSHIPAMTEYMIETFGKNSMKFTIHKTFEDKDANTLIVQAASDATSKEGKNWHNEYVFIVEVNPERTKIKSLTEYMDSSFVSSFNSKGSTPAQFFSE